MSTPKTVPSPSHDIIEHEKGVLSCKPVKIYTTPPRPFCRTAKIFLEANSVFHQEVGVAEDRPGRAEIIHKSGQMGVPVLDIGGEIVIGFDQAKVKQKLGL